jgi:hypothetical protein
MQIRFGSSISTSGDRWAYFDGSAYLLGARFFFGREEEVDPLSVTLVSAGLGRFAIRGDCAELFAEDSVVSPYWNLLSRVRKVVVAGDASMWLQESWSLETTFAFAASENSAVVERVRGMSVECRIQRRERKRDAPVLSL